MRVTPAVAVLTAMIISFATSLGAQVRTGQQVRWVAAEGVQRALFREFAPAGRVIVDTPDSAVVLDPAASAIEYRNGNRTKWGSAAIGMLVGGTIGAVAGLAEGDDECRPGSWCIMMFSAGEKATMGFIGGGLLGALVGAVAIPAGRWIPLRTDASHRIALLATPGRIGARVSF
jgi:hypothetical protein